MINPGDYVLITADDPNVTAWLGEEPAFGRVITVNNDGLVVRLSHPTPGTLPQDHPNLIYSDTLLLTSTSWLRKIKWNNLPTWEYDD